MNAAGSSSPLPLEIDVHELQRMRQSQAEFLLIDCREPHENQLVRIEGSKLIPMREIGAHLDELKRHQQHPIVVHCHHGGRSLRVTQFLREQGFDTAQNLIGGIHEWACRIDSSLPTY